MKKEDILLALAPQGDHGPEIEKYAAYCMQLIADEKQSFPKKLTLDNWVNFYKRVAADGLTIDGTHISIQSTGVTYDYVALKNKMLMVYPETLMDVGIVYEDDTFSCEKNSGVVTYEHISRDTFAQTEDKIVGAYCVIKNKRGEFMTTLTRLDLDKHKQVAKTKYIWNSWYTEMCRKTIAKKACKQHFEDIFSNIEEIDNENNDLSLLEFPYSKEEVISFIKGLNNFSMVQDYLRTALPKLSPVDRDAVLSYAQERKSALLLNTTKNELSEQEPRLVDAVEDQGLSDM